MILESRKIFVLLAEQPEAWGEKNELNVKQLKVFRRLNGKMSVTHFKRGSYVNQANNKTKNSNCWGKAGLQGSFQCFHTYK